MMGQRTCELHCESQIEYLNCGIKTLWLDLFYLTGGERCFALYILLLCIYIYLNPGQKGPFANLKNNSLSLPPPPPPPPKFMAEIIGKMFSSICQACILQEFCQGFWIFVLQYIDITMLKLPDQVSNEMGPAALMVLGTHLRQGDFPSLLCKTISCCFSVIVSICTD